MSWLGMREAAERLGVTPRQVQHLVAQGELAAPARGVIDADSADRFQAVHGSRRTRAWSSETAWGAIAILSRREAIWMGGTQRSRLKARLRTLSAPDLVARARGRARAVRYAGHSSVAERLRSSVVDTSAMRSRLGLADAATLDGYVAEGDLDGLLRRFGLVRDTSGRITLRTTAFPADTIRTIADADTVLAALDLAESLDVRERTIGLDALTDALERLRD